MCFYIHEDHQEIKIAEDNILCYKHFHYNTSTHAVSSFEKFKYTFGELYVQVNLQWPLNNVREKYDKIKVIEEGFHSYSELDAGTNEAITWGEPLHQCIIPKGSKYFYDPGRKQYVSNQIIIKEEIPKKS